MRVKEILSEDFLNYKKPSMFIASSMCDWKCCNEAGGIEVCQNTKLAQQPDIEIDDHVIYEQFITNNITKAVVIGGLEPMLQFNEINDLIKLFRANGCDCTFVIYTGYYKQEICEQIQALSQHKNVIVKFGRYIPGRPSKYDAILGIDLASDNQFAERL